MVGCIINTKLPSCVDITCCENFVMYGGLYHHTQVVLYIYLLLINNFVTWQIEKIKLKSLDFLPPFLIFY